MKQDRTVTIAAAAATLAVVAGWFVLPYMQAPAAAVDQEASVHVERARRLLHQYSPALAYGSMIEEQLKAADVDVSKSVDDIAGDGAKDYQAAHEARWAAYEPHNWNVERLSPATANYGDLRGQIRSGLSEREKLASKNQGLLDEAMREVDAALGVVSGDASGRSDVETNQLKGIILYQQGLTERARAETHREEAEWRRRELVELSESATKISSSRNLVADSSIDRAIEETEKKVAESESRIGERRAELQKVEEQVSKFQNRVADAQKRANDTNDRLEKLKSDGLNFADPKAGEDFEKKVGELNKEYTQAMREAHMLEFGGYPKAEIDRSGDYVRGHYVEGGSASDLTVDKGLRHFVTDRDVAAGKVNKETEALTNLRADLEALRQTKTNYQQVEAAAKSQIDNLAPKARDSFDELNRTESEALAIEEKALNYLDQAAKQFEQTSRLAEQWAGEGRQRTQNLSAELRPFSAYDQQANNRWLGGYTLAQVADARLEKAWIFYSRYKASLRDAEVLDAAKESLHLAEVDAAGERAKATSAKESGIDEIKLAMTSLQKAHRDVGNHWTVAAQAAGTTYLLALFGDTDYLADAVQGYRDALKSRENEPYMQKFAQRLKDLEGR